MKLIRNICIFALALFAVCALNTACADTLTVPPDTTVIGKEAFFGDSSLGGVSLPDGLLTIGGRAFAQSGVTSVNLPDTLTFIGSGAFKNSGSVVIYAPADSYAYSWAISNRIPAVATD